MVVDSDYEIYKKSAKEGVGRLMMVQSLKGARGLLKLLVYIGQDRKYRVPGIEPQTF